MKRGRNHGHIHRNTQTCNGKNEYFLVLDEHDNFENDNILNLLSKINRYIVDVDTSMEQFMKTMMSKFHLYLLVNCEGIQEELTKVKNYIWEKELKELNWKSRL